MEVEQKLAAGIDKSKLVRFGFTKKESETKLNWKHSREFEYEGQMYDIVEQSHEGDSLFYTCYKDHKETRLNNHKERIIAKALGQDPTRKSQSEKLINFIKTVFSRDSFAWFPFSPESSTIQFSTFNLQFSTFSPTPLSPPPKGV